MKEDKKELIRKAAIKIIAEKGFYNTRTSQIAKEAGIAVGTIYNYFDSKEEILEYIFYIELEKRLAFINIVMKKELDTISKLKLFLELHFTEIKNNIELGKILVREKEFPRNEGSDYIASFLQKIPHALSLILKKGIEKGEIKPCNPEVVGSMVFGAIQGLVEKAITSNQFDLFDKAVVELINILKQGLEQE